jgi:hypothetical protein
MAGLLFMRILLQAIQSFLIILFTGVHKMRGRTNVAGGITVSPFWGDGSDGILSAGATYLAGTDFEKYSGFCIKQFSEIDWDPATPETLTVDEPCRGLIIFVDGDVYIGPNATISMAKMGSILPVNPESLIEMYGDSVQMRHIVDVLKALRGGAGGDGGSGRSWNGGTAGTPGTGGIGRICLGGIGGGGSGGGNGKTGGDGGSVILPEVFGHGGWTGHIDGWQGGGGCYSTTTTGVAPGGNPYGGGGSGCSRGLAAEGEHAGGFILIIARGAIQVLGTLDVTGGNGGSITEGSTDTGGGGGGAGGGVIALFAQTSVDVSTATINKNGGQGGTGHQDGTGGQQGTLYTEAI